MQGGNASGEQDLFQSVGSQRHMDTSPASSSVQRDGDGTDQARVAMVENDLRNPRAKDSGIQASISGTQGASKEVDMSAQEQIDLLESRMVELGMLLAIAKQGKARKEGLPVNPLDTTKDGWMVQTDEQNVEGGDDAYTGMQTPEHIDNPVVQHGRGVDATSFKENLVEVHMGYVMHSTSTEGKRLFCPWDWTTGIAGIVQ